MAEMAVGEVGGLDNKRKRDGGNTPLRLPWRREIGKGWAKGICPFCIRIFQRLGFVQAKGRRRQRIPIYSTVVILLPVPGSQELSLRHRAQLGTGSAQSLCSKEKEWRFLLQEVSAAAPQPGSSPWPSTSS